MSATPTTERPAPAHPITALLESMPAWARERPCPRCGAMLPPAETTCTRRGYLIRQVCAAPDCDFSDTL